MTSPDRLNRLARAIDAASTQLDRHDELRRGPDASPGPGDLYVFWTPVDAAIEWLVVRPHPDDGSLLLLVPADDFPLTGSADVPLRPEFIDRPLTARCGESAWLPATFCRERLWVDRLPAEAVSVVRQALAALARGSLPENTAASHIEADPEYQAWMGQVAVAREAIESRANVIPPRREGTVFNFDRLRSVPPAWFSREPVALAAESGGPLISDLEEAMAADPAPRYEEIPLSGGTLVVVAGGKGVRLAWRSTTAAEPPTVSALTEAGRTVATWLPRDETKPRRAEPGFPWLDGEVVLEIADKCPQTVTIRL